MWKINGEGLLDVPVRTPSQWHGNLQFSSIFLFFVFFFWESAYTVPSKIIWATRVVLLFLLFPKDIWVPDQKINIFLGWQLDADVASKRYATKCYVLFSEIYLPILLLTKKSWCCARVLWFKLFNMSKFEYQEIKAEIMTYLIFIFRSQTHVSSMYSKITRNARAVPILLEETVFSPLMICSHVPLANRAVSKRNFSTARYGVLLRSISQSGARGLYCYARAARVTSILQHKDSEQRRSQLIQLYFVLITCFIQLGSHAQLLLNGFLCFVWDTKTLKAMVRKVFSCFVLLLMLSFCSKLNMYSQIWDWKKNYTWMDRKEQRHMVVYFMVDCALD